MTASSQAVSPAGPSSDAENDRASSAVTFDINPRRRLDGVSKDGGGVRLGAELVENTNMIDRWHPAG